MANSCSNCSDCKILELPTLNNIDFSDLERKILFLYNNHTLPMEPEELEQLLVKLHALETLYETHNAQKTPTETCDDEYFEALLKEYLQLDELGDDKVIQFRKQEIKEELTRNSIEIVQEGYTSWLAYYDNG